MPIAKAMDELDHATLGNSPNARWFGFTLAGLLWFTHVHREIRARRA